MNPEIFWTIVKEAKITHFVQFYESKLSRSAFQGSVPSQLQTWFRHLDHSCWNGKERVQSLKCVISSGEPLMMETSK